MTPLSISITISIFSKISLSISISISIFSKISLSISISISIFFKSVDISTIDIRYRYIEQGYSERTWMRLWNSNMDLKRLPSTNLNSGAVDRATNFSQGDIRSWRSTRPHQCSRQAEDLVASMLWNMSKMTSTLVQSRSQGHNSKLRSNAGFWNLTARTSPTDERGHTGGTLFQCLRPDGSQSWTPLSVVLRSFWWRNTYWRDSCQSPDRFQAWNFLSLRPCALPSDGRHTIGAIDQGQRGSSLGPRSLYGLMQGCWWMSSLNSSLCLTQKLLLMTKLVSVRNDLHHEPVISKSALGLFLQSTWYPQCGFQRHLVCHHGWSLAHWGEHLGIVARLSTRTKMEMTRPWVLLFGCSATRCSFWEPRPWVWNTPPIILNGNSWRQRFTGAFPDHMTHISKVSLCSS